MVQADADCVPDRIGRVRPDSQTTRREIMRLFLMVLILLTATIGAILRLFGLTGLRQLVDEARGAPAQTRYTRIRHRSMRGR